MARKPMLSTRVQTGCLADCHRRRRRPEDARQKLLHRDGLLPEVPQSGPSASTCTKILLNALTNLRAGQGFDDFLEVVTSTVAVTTSRPSCS
jgi:hypothetical protein